MLAKIGNPGALLLPLLLSGSASAAAPATASGAQVSHPSGTSLTVDPLRAEFARRLRDSGLVVHESYGSAGQPIDLAVEDPDHRGHVLVAVETDGPAYAAMRSSRDRDRLRGEQLGRLGWMHVRVWTTDLFRDPARDVARVNAAVQQAVANRLAATPPTVVAAKPEPTGPATGRASAAGAEEPQQMLPMGEASEPVQPDNAPDVAPVPAAGAGEFTPTSDQRARQRRVRGRKAKRVPDQTLLDPEPTPEQPEQPESEPTESDEPQPAAEQTQAEPAKPETKRPEQTKDDTDAGWGEQHDESAHDRWLREQRPPHWGSD